MHELSLLENVRVILEDHAREQHFERVEEITLQIGALRQWDGLLSTIRYQSTKLI